MTPAVAVIVVNYRQAALAARCVASLRREMATDAIEGQIVVVDCGSGREESAALEGLPADLCLLAENRGYSGGVNAGLARARAGRLIVSNADVEFLPGAVKALVHALDDPRVGAAAPVCSWDASSRILLPPGFDPGFLEELAMLGRGSSPRREDSRFAVFARDAVALWTRGGAARHLSGAVLAVRKDVFDSVGRFDERYLFEYEETDWERRLRAAGFELRVVAGARARHLWGGSASGEPETERRRTESRRLFRQRHYGRLGRVLLERAERRGRDAPRREPRFPRRGRLEGAEIPARPGAWLALSPNQSRIPFAGVDLSRSFSVPPEILAAAPRGDWFWTVFSAADGRPIETHVSELGVSELGVSEPGVLEPGVGSEPA